MAKSVAGFVPGWTWGVSIALHVGIVTGFGWLALRSLEHREAAARVAPAAAGGGGSLALELPVVLEGSLAADRAPDPKGDPPRFFGGAPEAQLDQSLHGRSGDRATPTPATNLSDRDERAHLTLDLLDRLDRDQQQRVKSARDRASWEDRRSSRDPMELTFVASGTGSRAERRTPAERDPSRGGALSASPSVHGGALGDPETVDGDEGGARSGGAHEGSRASASGLGVHDGRAGVDHRLGAHVTRARPDVTLAAISVPAARRGRTRDDIDSEQEVATAVRSIVHASRAAGAQGEGEGGIAGGGDPGAGGLSGAGSTGRPIGPGDAEWWDLDTSDARLLPYFRRIHQKLDPLWANAFPTRAALELKQGTVIFAVTIHADGTASVAWPPQRPSGVPEFDRNCYDAIERALPFDPIPAVLNTDELHVRMPFDARNPMVK